MSKQPEQILEDNLVAQLEKLGYGYIPVSSEKELLFNLKTQVEKHNRIALSNREFDRVLNVLSKGSVFDKAKILREKQHIQRDNGDSLYFDFVELDNWCQNEFQVTRQVNMEGSYKNRYDVTLLINGLPLVQIELKRRGIELKEAFNQVNRYQRHSYWASSGLFQYIQIFVISNGVNTKYYANNKYQSFKHTFYWSDEKNQTITQLEKFAFNFLDTCHISKMICRYIVLSEANKILMVLRPYQYYAVESLVERVINSNKDGYVWHTTGSGKTLTAFKASQILMRLPQVKKVVFVVDRKDLDYQTAKEFNSFSKGSIDSTDNTNTLVRQFQDDTKLIVTTIQKLNSAISKKRYETRMDKLKEERIVFIFDECHRSQFGETHARIREYFNNIQFFGFTGTPIFADNAVKNEKGKRTTTELFGECLHKYVITDAIRDGNVLKFSVEYVGRYKQKDDSKTNLDIEVEDIDTKELMESPLRLNKVADYILAHHQRKTYNKEFTAVFCVSSIETLIKYYDLFKQKKEEGLHNYRVVSIFSYTTNEEDKEAQGFIPEELSVAEEPKVLYGLQKHSREKLDEIIADYNKIYGTSYSTKDSESFYNYFNDISKRIKDRERIDFQDKDRVDILLVVNMFLTGFDAKKVNTMYVDKNLRFHGLVQAYSRTNRVLNEQKSQGNIVVFRNLKKATDEAITLFSNKNAKDVIIMQPYEVYVKLFNEAFIELLKITPTVGSVNNLPRETEELEFIKAFRELIRLKNILTTFTDFDFDDLAMNEQLFEDYKSKYLDLYEKVKFDHQKEKVSILEDVDFELELLHRDEINVAYILKLLASLKQTKEHEMAARRKEILDLLSGEARLRSKRELIEKFILENLPQIEDADNIPDAFEKFWNEEQLAAFRKLCEEENLSTDKVEKIIEGYLFAEREPLRDEVLDLIQGNKPSVLQRKKVGERILSKILRFVETFISGISMNEL